MGATRLPPAGFTIDEEGVEARDVRSLLDTHWAGMLANSPPDSCHFLDLEALRAADVRFWTGRIGGELAGIGALKRHDAQLGEVKSMRTHADHLGKGVGAALLRHMICAAREDGLLRLALETGSGEAFDAAHALYRRFGFVYGGPFGDYRPDPFSRFMTLDL